MLSLSNGDVSPGNPLFSQLHSKGFKSSLVLHSGGEHAMNHAGEKVFRTLVIAFALGLIIAFIAIAYLVNRLGDYEFRISELEYRESRLRDEIKGLRELIDRYSNETSNLEWWATNADIRINNIEGEIEDFKNLSGWRLKDIYWRILGLETEVEMLETRIKLLETP
jgi:hypothetical protein